MAAVILEKICKSFVPGKPVLTRATHLSSLFSILRIRVQRALRPALFLISPPEERLTLSPTIRVRLFPTSLCSATVLTCLKNIVIFPSWL